MSEIAPLGIYAHLALKKNSNENENIFNHSKEPPIGKYLRYARSCERHIMHIILLNSCGVPLNGCIQFFKCVKKKRRKELMLLTQDHIGKNLYIFKTHFYIHIYLKHYDCKTYAN